MATQFLILFFLGLLTSPTSYALLEEDEQEGRELKAFGMSPAPSGIF